MHAHVRAAFLAATLGLGSTASAQSPVPPPFTLRSDVAYGPSPAEQGDLFLPPPQSGHLRPAVLVIHGGGWIGGQRKTNAWQSGLIASRGFVVFNIDYRLAERAKPGTHWPAQLADAQLAVRWLRANAAAWQIDPARIGAVGDSAGGTLAVFLGAMDHPVASDQAQLLGEHASRVEAVIDQFGIMDLPALGASASVMVDNMFGSTAPSPGLLDTVSPLPFISGHSASMLIIHGDKDGFVPIAQSQQLREALASHGVAAQFITYAGGHGYEGVASVSIEALFGREIDWLTQHLMR